MDPADGPSCRTMRQRHQLGAATGGIIDAFASGPLLIRSSTSSRREDVSSGPGPFHRRVPRSLRIATEVKTVGGDAKREGQDECEERKNGTLNRGDVPCGRMSGRSDPTWRYDTSLKRRRDRRP